MIKNFKRIFSLEDEITDEEILNDFLEETILSKSLLNEIIEENKDFDRFLYTNDIYFDFRINATFKLVSLFFDDKRLEQYHKSTIYTDTSLQESIENIIKDKAIRIQIVVSDNCFFLYFSTEYDGSVDNKVIELFGNRLNDLRNFILDKSNKDIKNYFLNENWVTM